MHETLPLRRPLVAFLERWGVVVGADLYRRLDYRRHHHHRQRIHPVLLPLLPTTTNPILKLMGLQPFAQKDRGRPMPKVIVTRHGGLLEALSDEWMNECNSNNAI
jgi:hypothetical protein